MSLPSAFASEGLAAPRVASRPRATNSATSSFIVVGTFSVCLCLSKAQNLVVGGEPLDAKFFNVYEFLFIKRLHDGNGRQ